MTEALLLRNLFLNEGQLLLFGKAACTDNVLS